MNSITLLGTHKSGVVVVLVLSEVRFWVGMCKTHARAPACHDT